MMRALKLPPRGRTLAALDTLFEALADPTRVRILNVLGAGELCVRDIVDILGLPQPTVSRHLGVLRRAGLVRAFRAWKFVHYRLSAPAGRGRARLAADARHCFHDIPSLRRERRAAGRRVREREIDPC